MPRSFLRFAVVEAAVVLALHEDDEHSDGKERVRVTGAIDCEFAGVIPLRMTAGLPHFLFCSPSALPDSSDNEQHDVGGSGDGVLPVWVNASMDRHSRGSVLLRAVRDGDRVARVWQETLREGEDGDDDEDEAWAGDELVPAA
jgi:hypothetical protein